MIKYWTTKDSSSASQLISTMQENLNSIKGNLYSICVLGTGQILMLKPKYVRYGEQAHTQQNSAVWSCT